MKKPSKELILKLLKSDVREDVLIGLSLMVNFYDPEEFIKSYQIQQVDRLKEYDYWIDDKIPSMLLFEYSPKYGLTYENCGSIGFYYQYQTNKYILYHPDAICICYKSYSPYVNIIKHG